MYDKINELRKNIRQIDEQTLRLIKQRLRLAEEIGKIKAANKLPIANLEVESENIDKAVFLSKELGIDEDFTRKLINLLMAESVKIQSKSEYDKIECLYKIFEKAKELERKGEKVIRLEVGEPDFEPPSEIKMAARAELREDKPVKYVSSKGLDELRLAVANYLLQEYGVNIKTDQVLITPGGKYAIFAAILSLISFQDRVIIIEPSWPVYSECVKLANGRIDYIHTALDDNWRIDIEKIETAINAGAKLLIINNPCNPTGKIIPEEELTEIAGLAEKKNVYILSDEVYSAYSFKPFKSILELSNSRFIYVNSFSKKYGMTGWRIGYAVSDSDTILKMQKLIQVSMTCVPEFIQKTAVKALSMDKSKFDVFKTKLMKRIEIACNELSKLPLSYSKPDGAMYIFPRIDLKNFRSLAFVEELLIKKKVAVSPGEAFGDYPSHIRISLSTDESEIVRGIRRIGEVLSTIK
jgi:aspartate aminotransferase